MLLALRLPAFKEATPAGGPMTARFERQSFQEAIPQAPVARREKRLLSQPALVASKETVPVPAKDEPSAAQPVATAAASAIQTAAPAPMLDAGSIARYRQQLIGIAARYKRYPQEALEAGAEGIVSVRVNISPTGLADVAVKTSSGHELLDAQAIEMFRSAAPQVPLPPSLLGHAFGVEVRAIYSLND